MKPRLTNKTRGDKMIYISIEEPKIDFAYYVILLHEQHIDIRCKSFEHFKQEVKRFMNFAYVVQHGDMKCKCE